MTPLYPRKLALASLTGRGRSVCRPRPCRAVAPLDCYYSRSGMGGIDGTDLAKAWDRWWALVHTVMNLRFSHNAGTFLTSWGPVVCSWRVLLQEVNYAGTTVCIHVYILLLSLNMYWSCKLPTVLLWFLRMVVKQNRRIKNKHFWKVYLVGFTVSLCTHIFLHTSLENSQTEKFHHGAVAH